MNELSLTSRRQKESYSSTRQEAAWGPFWILKIRMSSLNERVHFLHQRVHKDTRSFSVDYNQKSIKLIHNILFHEFYHVTQVLLCTFLYFLFQFSFLWRWEILVVEGRNWKTHKLSSSNIILLISICVNITVVVDK